MWNSENDKWLMHLVPECYFDTVLLKGLLNISSKKRMLHKKGCTNVVKALTEKDLKDAFAIAMVDKDKNELDYLKDCDIVFHKERIILWKHKIKQQFVIQLSPPLEKWIKEVLNDMGLNISELDYSVDEKKLKKEIKFDIDNEDNSRLNKLVKTLVDSKTTSILCLKQTLVYLIENNYNADINKLKEILN